MKLSCQKMELFVKNKTETQLQPDVREKMEERG